MAKTNEWSFTPQKVGGVGAKTSPAWYGVPRLRPSVDINDTIGEVAEKTGLDPYKVLHVYAMRDEAVLNLLKGGHNVNTRLAGFTISMTGTLKNVDAEFDRSANAMEVSLHAKPLLRDCLAGVRPRNTVGHLSCNIGSIMDPVAREEGVLTTPDGLMAGRSMKINPRNDDEYLHLLYRNGQLAAVPQLTANNTGTIDFSLAACFDALEDGEYVMELSARNGASADYAPAVARKAVIIRKAVREAHVRP